MESRSRILLGVISSIAVSVVIAIAAFSILKGMNTELRQGPIYDDIIEKTQALNILTASFNEGSAQSNANQFKGILLSLDKLLKGISTQVPGEEVVVRQLQRNYQELGPLIDQMFFSGQEMAGDLEKERRSILSSQVWMKVRFIMDDTNRLRNMSQTRIIAAQEKAGAMVIALIIILALTNGGIYFFSGRNIMSAQEALWESENRLRRFYESGLLGVFYWNMNGQITDANDKFLEMGGFDREDLAAGRIDLGRMALPESGNPDEDSMTVLKATGIKHEPSEKEFICKDGARLPILIAGAMLDETSFNGAAFVLDITDRKRAEKDLRETATELQAANADLADSRRAAINLLEDALDARRQAEEAAAAVRESEERLHLAVSATDLGTWDYNPVTGALNWDARCKELFGLLPETEVNYDTFLAGLHPDDREHTHQVVQGMLDPASGGKYDIEYRTVGLTDGDRVRWVHATGQVFFNDAGQAVRFTGTVQDITERKLAEERLQASLHEKEMLLKEIHHRVKNNLQVISSLVGLQAEGSQDETVREVLREVTYRVRSMALVHEKLYQSADLAQIEFADYSRNLLNYLWRAHGSTASTVRLAFDLEPVSLPVDTAVPCGLILNELAGNALKHAFRGRDSGEVSVSLRSTPDGRVLLCLRDNGVGLPMGLDWRQARSLGLRLVHMLAGQLKAGVEVSGGEGTSFEITFEVSRGGAEGAEKTKI